MMDPMAILGPIFDFIMANLVGIIILFVVQLLIGALFLKLAIGWLKGQNTGFGAVFLTYIIGQLLSIIPCLGCILAMVVTKRRHEIGFWSSVGAWLIGGILASLVSYAVSFLLAFVLGGNLLAELYELLRTLVPIP